MERERERETEGSNPLHHSPGERKKERETERESERLTPRPDVKQRRSASAQGLGIRSPALSAVQASKQAREAERRVVR